MNFPDDVWRLIKNFYFQLPSILAEKNLLAECAKFMRTVCMPKHPLGWWERFEERSHSHTISRQVLSNNMEWDYGLINSKSYYIHDHKFVNMFQKPGTTCKPNSSSHGYPGLTVSQWRILLEMNGVEGVSRMNRTTLIREYLRI